MCFLGGELILVYTSVRGYEDALGHSQKQRIQKMEKQKSKSNKRLERLRNTSGFTFVEAMIVVVLMAILATVAIPRYSSYVEKTN